MKTIKCKICNFEATSLTSHINRKHGINGDEYKKRFGDGPLAILSDDMKKRISNSVKKLNTPEYRKKLSHAQKNGGSQFTEKYWTNRGFSEDQAKEKITVVQKKNAKKSAEKTNYLVSSWMNIGYWTSRGYTVEEAKKEISNRQSILSKRSSKFRGHTRTLVSKKKISNSVRAMINSVGKDVWVKHFGEFNGRSKTEIDLYEFVKNNICHSVKANCIVDRYIVDIINGRKVIEFYGDFWHANPLYYLAEDIVKIPATNGVFAKDIWSKDRIRIDTLKNLGYDVLIIWETDWRQRKEECIEKIKEFL